MPYLPTELMRIPHHNRLPNWAVATLVATVVLAGTQLLVVDGNSAAHQPDGLSISQTEIPEPPCPYGHDDGCEFTSSRPTTSDPYQSPDPHAPLLHVHAGFRYPENSASIAHLKERVAARISQAGTGTAVEGGEPGDDNGGVSYAITDEIAGLPWAGGQPTPSEKLTLEWLGELQEHNPSLVSALVRMPFLQDHSPGDLQAIQTLTLISRGISQIPPAPDYAAEIVNAESFVDDDGVDDTEAKIIAVMGIPYLNEDTRLIELLTEHGTVEEQTTNLPSTTHASDIFNTLLGNSIDISIVRVWTSRQGSDLMQTATTAIADAETLMGAGLPTDFVGILVADLPGAAGANNSITIQVDAGFDGTYYSDRYRQRVIGHEIGHYWWSSNARHEHWLSEGAAEYIGAYTVRSQFGDNDVRTDMYPCPYYRTIEHLRADSPAYGWERSYGSLCNYSLGERLFINLDRVMTTAAFNAAFRDLYRRVSTYEQDEIDQGLSLTRAFCSQCRQQQSRQRQINLPSAGHVLARRYGEKVFTDSSAPEGSIPGLGQAQNVRINDYRSQNRQYGVAQVPASSPDQRRWIRVDFRDVTDPPDTVSIFVDQYHEEREPWGVWSQERQVYSRDGNAWFYAYLGAPVRRAPGHHWVYIYSEQDQKIAEVEYQVVP